MDADELDLEVVSGPGVLGTEDALDDLGIEIDLEALVRRTRMRTR